jgi:hypothetical protein
MLMASSVGSRINKEAGLVGLRHTLRGLGPSHARESCFATQRNAETDFVITPANTAARSDVIDCETRVCNDRSGREGYELQI